MTRIEESHTLALLAVPGLDEPLPAIGTPWRQTSDPADDAAYCLTGRRSLVSGGEARGVDEVLIDPFRVLVGLRVEGAIAREVVVTPIDVERRLTVDGRTVVERAFVPRDLPGAIFEWTLRDGGELALSWRAMVRPAASATGPTTGPVRWRRDDRSLLIHGEEPDRSGLFILSETPADWRVTAVADDDEALDCSVRFHLDAGGSVRLAVVAEAGGGDRLTEILSALRPDALVLARVATLRRIRTERLEVRAPDSWTGEALGWAKSRLDAYPIEVPAIGPGHPTRSGATAADRFRTAWTDHAWAALGALAAGDFDGPRAVVRTLGAALDGVDGTDAVRTVRTEVAPSYLLLTARYLAWTGDRSLVREQWPRLQRLAETGPGAGAADEGLWAVALRELAVAAEGIGEKAASEALEHASEALWRGTTGEPPGPMPEGVAWALDVKAPERRAGLAEFETGRTEAATRLWREYVEQGFRSARGVWRRSPGAPDRSAPFACDDARSTAAVASGFVYGLLGAEPDATRHRLRLRPQVPDDWPSLEVRQLRLGDAAISVRYEREGERHLFRIDQETGSVPVRVIFEPLLPGRRLVAARVDGQDAVLDPRPFGERLLVPVQIVLDYERTIELETGAGGPTRIRLPVMGQ